MHLSLYQLNHRVATAVRSAVDAAVWVTAEVSELRTASNGHCYMELVEKEERTGSVVARARAVVWRDRWWLVAEAFERGTGSRLAAGMKIMVQVEVDMHEAYGYTLNVVDIDPSHTLGEMARRRREILQRLEAEGMLDMNATLEWPRLPQRVAVISAAGAAGYGDFCHQLASNPRHLAFYVHLFPAVMQGQRTERSVIAALEAIYARADTFDLVVILRGGGSTTDLASFDSYDIAAAVANFPLPVVTAIGHERDTTVLDAVAHTAVKTPTAAAALLIEQMEHELDIVATAAADVRHALLAHSERQQQRLAVATSSLRSTRARLAAAQSQLTLMAERLRLFARQRIERDTVRLEHTQVVVEMMRPEHILQRGFSITMTDGHTIRSADDVRAGSTIVTRLADGTLTSHVD